MVLLTEYTCLYLGCGSHQNFYGFPCHNCHSEDIIDSSVKIAIHHPVVAPLTIESGTNNSESDTATPTNTNPNLCSPNSVDRVIDKNEISTLLAIIRTKLPDLLLNDDCCIKNNHHIDENIDTYSVPVQQIPTSVTENNSYFHSNDESQDYKIVHATTCLYTLTKDEHFLIDWKPGCENTILLVSACSGHGFKFTSVIGEIVADLVENNETIHDISLFRLLNR